MQLPSPVWWWYLSQVNKFCNTCKENKLLFGFQKNQSTEDGYCRYCKSCRSYVRKASYRKNKERYIEKQINWNNRNKSRIKGYVLKRLYGISLEDYQKMLSSQKNCCKICLKQSIIGARKLAVDHCHKTGKIRGLLCTNCNIFLGYLELVPNIYIKTQQYLQEAK
jgi:hypothetical protein